MTILTVDEFTRQAHDCFDTYLPLTDKKKYLEELPDTIRKLGCSRSLSKPELQTAISNCQQQQPLDKSQKVLEGKIKESLKRVDSLTHMQLTNLTSDAYRLYEQSYRGELGFKVLGSSEMRDASFILQNFQRLHTPPASAPSSPKKQVSTSASASSILQPTTYSGAVLNDYHWNILKNDAAMLGTIHAHQDVYIAYDHQTLSNLEKHSLYKDGFIRVLPRELIQLQAAGYVELELPIPTLPLPITNEMGGYSKEVVLVCQDLEKASRFTISDMITAVKDLFSAQAVREKLDQMPRIPYESYDKQSRASASLDSAVQNRPSSANTAEARPSSANTAEGRPSSANLI